MMFTSRGKWKITARFFSTHSTKLLILASMMVVCGVALIQRNRSILVFLPGTQVGTVEIADDVQICRQCHYSSSQDRPVTLEKEWAGSMMAQSARDPIFYAALAVANKYHPSVGEYCIRCHSPSGWLAGHSEDFTGRALAGTDFDGVQCDYCHRTGDPLNPDSTLSMVSNYRVPGYGNGMHAVQKFASPKRGPFDSVLAPHQTKHDPFQQTSELCGVCHDVSNPFYASDRTHQAPYEYGPLERTYSEWAMSSYALQGDSGTCQSCHMKSTTGYACIYVSAPLRTDLAQHDLTGGNTFVPDILPDFWSNLDTSAIAEGKQRALVTLQRAADLDVQASKSGDTVTAIIRVTNKTGHKLPTGYPDGRRMWINVVGRSLAGDTVFQSGFYNIDSAILVPDNQLKVYQAIQGLTDSAAALYQVPAGPSLHFALNDTILSDNRIPPKGFTNASFQQRLAQPVGVIYPDSQYWDDTKYILPPTTVEVGVTQFYQTISKNYVEFLRDENQGNPNDWNSWGDKLYAAWTTRGKSQPAVMSTQTVPVKNAMGVSDDLRTGSFPRTLTLRQNFPNPFNPSTVIRFEVRGSRFISLSVYDLLGKEVASLVRETKQTGSYEVSFDASALPSGLYFYSLESGSTRITRKMLIIR